MWMVRQQKNSVSEFSSRPYYGSSSGSGGPQSGIGGDKLN